MPEGRLKEEGWMNKQYQGSKKKARRAAYRARVAAREARWLQEENKRKALESGNIETIAKAMGIKL